MIAVALVGACSSQPLTLTSERAGATSVVVGDHVYVIGGSQHKTALRSLERAAVRTDGSIGPFEAVETNLVSGRADASSVVIGAELFVFGGNDGSSALQTIERASIATDGTLGGFETIATGTPLTLHNLGSSAPGAAALYFTGGQDSVSHAVTDSERTSVNPDGSVGAFASDAQLRTARYLHSSVVVGSNLYVIGGNSGTSMLSSVERAIINSDGSLGGFATVPSSLVTARMSHESVVVGGQLYVLGGVNGPLASVKQAERAVIAADGSLGAFESVPGGSFVSPRVEVSTAIIGDFLYAFGGFTPNGDTNTVERARVNSDGSLGDFEVVTD